MSQKKASAPSEPYDPSQLPESERAYYRLTWGFDPVAACQTIWEGIRMYEACFPLDQDAPLHALGIAICARVEWQGTAIHNYIVFQRDDEEGSIKCTHTVVYAGPAGDALTFARDGYTERDILTSEGREMIRLAGGTVSLPPWEHFVALRSYVGAVAEAGVLALLEQAFAVPEDPAEGLPFGFNAVMHQQVLQALKEVTPVPLCEILKDLAVHMLEQTPPATVVEQWKTYSKDYDLRRLFTRDPDALLTWVQAWAGCIEPAFLPKNARKKLNPVIESHWQYLVENARTNALVRWFRLTDIADSLQNRIFRNAEIFSEACALAPAVPWNQLRLEWKARLVAKRVERFRSEHLISPEIERKVKIIPAAEVWPRGKFTCFTFPKALLGPYAGHDVPAGVRRKRVLQYLGEVIDKYQPGSEDYLKSLLVMEEMSRNDPVSSMVNVLLGDILSKSRQKMIDYHVGTWAKKLVSDVDRAIASPFPLELAKLDSEIQKNFQTLSKEAITSHIQSGSHNQRRNMALILPLPIDLQEELATHWDFATRLALIGNPETGPAVIAALARDPQPCVRAAAEARLRRGENTIEPLLGEVLDPGELVWFLAAHPMVFFYFGVTTWDDGRGGYADWVAAQFRQKVSMDLKGESFLWGYQKGFFYEWLPYNKSGSQGWNRRYQEEWPTIYTFGYQVSHLALRGLENFACGHLPCLYLGVFGWNTKEGEIGRLPKLYWGYPDPEYEEWRQSTTKAHDRDAT